MSYATGTTLIADSDTPSPTSIVTYTAYVSALDTDTLIPAGNVVLSIDSIAQPAVAVDADGEATFQKAYAAFGTYVVTAQYIGDASGTTSTSNSITTIALLDQYHSLRR